MSTAHTLNGVDRTDSYLSAARRIIRDTLICMKQFGKQQTKESKIMPILKTKNKASKPLPTKSGTSARSADKFGSAWGKTAAADKTMSLPLGVHEAFITNANFYDSEEDERTSIYLEFTVVSDPKLEGRKGRAWYNVFDADGKAARGLEFLKRDLVLMGFDEEIEAVDSREAMETLLSSLVKAKLWVVIEVKTRNGYTNTYLQDVPDQDSEDKPEAPEVEED